MVMAVWSEIHRLALEPQVIWKDFEPGTKQSDTAVL